MPKLKKKKFTYKKGANEPTMPKTPGRGKPLITESPYYKLKKKKKKKKAPFRLPER